MTLTDVTHEIPSDAVEYIHTGTDDLVRYIGRDDGAYRFTINGGDRTLDIPVEMWPDYREYLVEGAPLR